jgi:hypothetical protein
MPCGRHNGRDLVFQTWQTSRELVPWSFTFAATFSACRPASVQAQMATRALASTSWRARTKPSPHEPPLTIIVFPAKENHRERRGAGRATSVAASPTAPTTASLPAQECIGVSPSLLFSAGAVTRHRHPLLIRMNLGGCVERLALTVGSAATRRSVLRDQSEPSSFTSLLYRPRIRKVGAHCPMNRDFLESPII